MLCHGERWREIGLEIFDEFDPLNAMHHCKRTVDVSVRRDSEPCSSSIRGFGENDAFALAVFLDRWAQDRRPDIPVKQP